LRGMRGAGLTIKEFDLPRPYEYFTTPSNIRQPMGNKFSWEERVPYIPYYSIQYRRLASPDTVIDISYLLHE